MLLKQRQVGLMAVFAYLVGDPDSKEGLVIDPAADIDGLLTEAKNNGLTIKYILNTHGHVDHTAGNTLMKSRTGAQIVIHKDDADMLISTPPMILKMFGATKSPPADMTVTDGNIIKIGKISLEVIHVPGHSPGSVAFLADGAVFTGDTLFVEAVGRTDLPGGSWQVMSSSIKERLFSLPDDTTVLPGHNYGRFPTSTIGHEKTNNPYL